MNKLFNLIQKPTYGSGLRCEANSIGQPTLYLYGEIGGFGVTAEDFSKELNRMEGDVVRVRVNSAGGDFFEGRSMQASIAEHPAKVILHCDGLIGSAATLLLLAADEKRISNGGYVMIHRPYAITGGQSERLRQQADLLDEIEKTAIADYASMTGVSHEKISGWVKSETWFSAVESQRNGFGDYIDSGQAIKNCVYNLAPFEHVPKELRNRGLSIAKLRERELEIFGIKIGEDHE